ncbi:Uncharacterized protein ALO68_01251 [Pseudomonas syringae pv. helianthi]|uniref:Phage terminase, small subunit n=3 Tax=Pseudomonas syringae group genomosp. 7 TaxID=251699 RepID=A0A0P9RE48_9PSED|nr:Uncharacterized protein ALO68_01251 [Pseudomonas syringae pv. helianthi]KPY86304.1 Uncharacterized protein ALO44_01095 [Pseudomonas syringae pv. tagetis]RMR03321.1 hypothetical protein ALP93_100207 [Pseudomonas syringae pv. helianthi]RMV47616.1 hypothetical protein ALP10_00239 [Pseudomonas syringae pv. helianthi]RMW11867.1 hypothetical protein ALO98_100200 [Pseudomonas syringae pv. tagetis]
MVIGERAYASGIKRRFTRYPEEDLSMNKPLPDLQLTQWHDSNDNQEHSASLALYLIAVPLFILATLLILNGLFSESLSSIAIGVIGLVAALVFQRKDAARSHQKP